MTKQKKKNKIIVTFDKNIKSKIVQSLGFSKDKEGYLVDEHNPSQRVISPDGLEVLEDNFAGVKKGSLLLYNSDLPSLIKLADKLALKK